MAAIDQVTTSEIQIRSTTASFKKRIEMTPYVAPTTSFYKEQYKPVCQLSRAIIKYLLRLVREGVQIVK